jgi:hypothetical protein
LRGIHYINILNLTNFLLPRACGPITGFYIIAGGIENLVIRVKKKFKKIEEIEIN